MKGIDFMVRDRAGWLPPLPLLRRRLRWNDAKVEAIKSEEIEFISSARGRISTYDLGKCYGVSPQTISNIWARPIKRTMTGVFSNKCLFEQPRH